MDDRQTHIFHFGNFSLDQVKRLLLTADGEIVPLMPKAFDTLLYLVRHGGKVIEKDELMREIWADTVVEENNLTQNISILRRIFGEKPGEHRFIVTVPGRGYKFVAEVKLTAEPHFSERFPSLPKPAASLPTNLESRSDTQPPAQNREIGVDNDIKPVIEQRLRDRRFLITLGVIVVVALTSIGFLLWRENSGSATRGSIRTLAVLPFKPLIAGDQGSSLELGMADTLINKISSTGEIIVRPLGSVRRFADAEQDPLTAGRELGVDAVLEGNIQMSAGRIRVSARLIETLQGKQLWNGQFDENFTDIFSVQDAISERVAAALKIGLGNAEKKRPTESVVAYELYTKGRYHAHNLTRSETDKALAYFQKAIETDPEYAHAYIGLAQTYLPMALTSAVPSWEVLPKAKAAAVRAVELDETLAESHFILGFLFFWHDWDWQAAEKEYSRALELDPNSADAHFGYAHLLSNIGRHERAIEEIKIARGLDPVSLRFNSLEGQILGFAGKYDEAIDRLQQTIDLNPNYWLSHLFISQVYIQKGMYAEAIVALETAGRISGNPQAQANRVYALAEWGKTSEATALFNELVKLSATRYVPPYNFAVAHMGLGEREKALDYLQKSYDEKDVRMVFLNVDPTWNNLRNEPRFIDLMKRMNF